MVADGEFATAPFLHAADEAGWPVVAHLKDNLPELFQAAQRRFRFQSPHLRFRDGPHQVELWEADDLDPWETLQWETVPVIRYRQHHPNGEVVEAYWLTHLSSRRISRRCLYAMAKSRWQIENQGFNDAKNRYGLEHICDHHPRSLLIVWLLTCWALTLERLYRLRYLHRGTHPAHGHRLAPHLAPHAVPAGFRRFQLRADFQKSLNGPARFLPLPRLRCARVCACRN